MKETQCQVEDCKEIATYSMDIEIGIKSNTIADSQKISPTHIPLCKFHAILFDVAGGDTLMEWGIAEMNQVVA